MPRLKVIFCGSGEFGLPTLRSLVDAHEVIHVFSQPDRPAGRGRKLTPTPIAQFALERNLPLTRTADLNVEPLPPADVMVVIAFGPKIARHVVNHPRLGSVNLHSSRLPKYRGAAPINWAVINGDATTGNSVIRLAEKMDAGAVLGQSELPILELETAGELHDRLSTDGVSLMARVLADLATGGAVEREQDHALASVAPKLSREKSALDWTAPPSAVANQIRGMYPWPGCRVELLADSGDPQRVTLVRARPATAGIGPPGTILPSGAVAVGGGSIEVVELQPEGKRPMPLTAYKNGRPWTTGMRVVSITS